MVLAVATASIHACQVRQAKAFFSLPHHWRIVTAWLLMQHGKSARLSTCPSVCLSVWRTDRRGVRASVLGRPQPHGHFGCQRFHAPPACLVHCRERPGWCAFKSGPSVCPSVHVCCCNLAAPVLLATWKTIHVANASVHPSSECLTCSRGHFNHTFCAPVPLPIISSGKHVWFPVSY
jgi:hypothetical protein